jgi:type VI secretion system protein ImpL
MKKKTKMRVFPSTMLLSFLGLAWVGSVVLRLQGSNRMIFQGALAFLGLGMAFMMFRYLSRSLPKESSADAPQKAALDEIDRLFSEVRRRLTEGGIGGGKIGRLPVFLFVGPAGSTKTSLLEVSGLNTEHLAGEVYRGESVVSTETANAWFGEGAMFVEAGGKLLDEPKSWSRLIRHLRPRRIGAVLGRGRQAPRLAVVCYPCDELDKPGSSESVTSAAREIRRQLMELGESLGVRLPVYVFFTKADRIPYFEEYVASFSTSETGDVLGATLPISADPRGKAYAERESQRVYESFDGLIHSLALRRVELLRREASAEGTAGTYEFPREVRKIRDVATQFLVDLCRPSQLSVSPFLRGFYFTGVRPVVSEESAPAPAPHAFDASPVGATRIFDAGGPAQPAAVPPSGTRRVPQWVFVRRLFRDVLLDDQVAMAITGGGVRVNLLRRLVAGSAVALGTLLVLGTTVSFFQNRSLTNDVQAALGGAELLARAPEGRASLEDLRLLDDLREQVQRLRTYESGRRPLSYRWGLYKGSAIFPDARGAYFRLFDRVLGRDVRTSLVSTLDGLPDVPGESTDFNSTYDDLKAYLQVTSYADSATQEFLAPVLVRHWGRSEGDESVILADSQFAFYARELPIGEPADLADLENTVVAARARAFLRRFTDVDHYYQSMLARAGRGSPPIRFGEAGVLSDPVTVPGAFTAPGWDFVQDNLGDIDELLAREEYVMGPQSFSDIDPEELAEALEARYVTDYVGHWRDFLRSASVQGLSASRAAARTLERLSSNTSPIFQLLWMISANTTLDSGVVYRAFQPVHHVMPFDTAGGQQLIVPANNAYIDALSQLSFSIGNVADARDEAEEELNLGVADGDAEAVIQSVRQLAQGFSSEGEARANGSLVQSLLESPAQRVQRLVAGIPAAGARGRGEAFCAALSDLTSKYPFNMTAGQQATIEELDAALKPGESELWAFEADLRERNLIRRRGTYVVESGARPQPTSAFLAYFNRAVRISESLYADGERAAVDFVLTLETSDEIPEVTLRVDGQELRFRQREMRRQNLRWDGARAQTASITRGTTLDEQTVLSFQGPWALFRLLGAAAWTEQSPSQFGLQWQLPTGETLQGQLQLSVSARILDPRFLAGLRGCVPPIP